MANPILRPRADGHYTTTWSGFPGVNLYDSINENDSDADVSYVSTSSAGAFTTLFTNSLGGSWPRATRIPSIRVVATVRTTGVSAEFRFRLRSYSTDYDTTETFVVTSSSYVEVGYTYSLLPNGRAWDLPTLNRLEAGLVFITGDELRCTKLEVFVHYETFPHYTLAPDAAGHHQDWAPVPATSPPTMVVNGVYDGDLSYLANTGVTDISTFEFDELPAALTPANIDRVAVKALVKNVGTVPEVASVVLRSAGWDYMGGTSTVGVTIQPDGEWRMLSEEYLNDPGLSWPSGNPAGIPWVVGTVNAVELGIENSGGGDFRCTATAVEVWLAATPPTTIDLYPTADGTHIDWSTLVPGAPAWGTVDEAVPDDIVSYLILDADTAGTPQYASFTVGGAGAVPAGERIYNVEARYRIRLGNLPHSQALIAPVTRAGGETYIGRPQLIEGTAGTWFDIKWDFPVEPYTGLPWAALAAVTTTEFGFAVLEGTVLLSRLRAQVQTILDYRGTPDATDFQFTDAAVGLTGLITRSRAEGLIYAITEFAVGSSGYAAADPSTVTAVVPSTVALTTELYRTGIGRIEFDGASEPQTADYWCRVPQEEAQGGLGEFGLFAEILRSPADPTEEGTVVLFALAHHPCQTRHMDAAQFYLTRFSYPTSGATVWTDGDMEAVGTAVWTAAGGAALTKQLVNPHGGLQLLRVAGIIGSSAYQVATTVVGVLYRVAGWARSDGVAVPSVDYAGAAVAFWTGTISTAWQPFNVLVAADSVDGFLLRWAAGAGAHVEFDDVSVVEPYDVIYGAELLVDGDAEAVGVGAWAAIGGAVLTKQVGTPYEGLQVLRNAGAPGAIARQTILTIGVLYRVTGRVRSDGTSVPRVLEVAGAVWTGTTATTWQIIDASFVATGATLDFELSVGAGHAEFDILSIVEVVG